MSRKPSIPHQSIKTKLDATLEEYKRVRDKLAGKIVGVAIVGRPVSRFRDDGLTAEITRLCTDGTRNACSFLYGAASRAAFALGFKRIGTYILASEPGTSLTAAGWRLIGETPGKSWSVPSRPRVDKHPLQKKLLFEKSA
jgi:hypothetical protein